MPNRIGLRVLGMIAILIVGMIGAPTAAAAQPNAASCDSRTNNTHKKLLECVTLAGVREHQAALPGDRRRQRRHPRGRHAGLRRRASITSSSG